VRALLTNNFVRGGITGLGLVNLAAGLIELARLVVQREPRGASGPAGSSS
jgi:hypothetical protein